MTARGEPRGLAPPEWRVRRECHELAEVRSQRVDDLDRPIRIVDGHVNVQSVDQLPPSGVLELVDQRPVAIARHDRLPFEQAERMGAGRAQAQALASSRQDGVPAQTPQLAGGVAHTRADPGVISTNDSKSSGETFSSNALPFSA